MIGSARIKRLKGRATKAGPTAAASKIRAVGYVRVSTDGQVADGHGIDAQDRAIRAFAVSQGYDLVDVVREEGVSGASRPAERPGFVRVLELAEGQSFTVLLVYKFDRLARHLLHAVTTVHDLRDRFGVVLRSVSEPIDTSTAMGEMIFTILAGMAAQERITITERTMGGRKEKAIKGGFAGGRAPYGYTHDQDRRLVVVEEQAAVVRRIFAERAAGITLQGIANGLNADGIPSPTGGIWRAGGVHYITDNPKYQGHVEYLFRFGGAEQHVLRPGDHAAIV
ncbi:recombinase family protein [Methylobacterium gossipiicola]|uniref:Site-specific DNA recombinase n=1 Tax=Methylobacterium gossipiicola TaxID=582675 RepID=A0A1I2TJT6_9HYPH|nr:recombinase family protein [Methylobacterium gossipiicola]SFG65182.1 site-specific DNA recombinase [Methylobacterium gossipiicola]